MPQQWASTQNNLGLALSLQAERSEGVEAVRLLNDAVSAYRDALKVYTEIVFPRQFALLLSNLEQAETKLQKLKP